MVDVSSTIVIDAVGVDHVGIAVPFDVNTCPVVPFVMNEVAFTPV